MKFDRLLTHICTIVSHDELIGYDDYNRPVYGDSETKDVVCRVDQIKKFVSRDTNGANFITQYALYTGDNQELKNDMTIKDLKDKQGNTVLAGEFTLESAMPVYNRIRIHHYEATLKGSE